MKYWPVPVIFILLAIIMFFPGKQTPPPAVYVDPQLIRDSLASSLRAQEAARDSFRDWLALAKADTLAAILRDRARRRPIYIHDTISLLEPEFEDMVVSDSFSCSALLSCNEMRRLALRDSSQALLAGSLAGDKLVLASERDSIAARFDSLQVACRPSPPIRSFSYGFAAGFSTGLGVCVLLN